MNVKNSPKYPEQLKCNIKYLQFKTTGIANTTVLHCLRSTWKKMLNFGYRRVNGEAVFLLSKFMDILNLGMGGKSIDLGEESQPILI